VQFLKNKRTGPNLPATLVISLKPEVRLEVDQFGHRNSLVWCRLNARVSIVDNVRGCLRGADDVGCKLR